VFTVGKALRTLVDYPQPSLADPARRRPKTRGAVSAVPDRAAEAWQHGPAKEA